MRSALYYPHVSVENESLVKTALLLWDRLEFIVPFRGFKPEYQNPLMARAMELIGAPRVPNQEEQKETHSHIAHLVQQPLPPQFYFQERTNKNSEYEMHPEKLLPETWQILKDSKLSGSMLPNMDFPMTEPAGLTIMSILADCCAGSTRSRVTDRGAAYATLAGILGNDSGDVLHANVWPQEHLFP